MDKHNANVIHDLSVQNIYFYFLFFLLFTSTVIEVSAAADG